MGTMISVTNLTKRYNKKSYVVKDLTFNIQKKEIFAFIGLKDSGKTSVLRLLANISKPSSGKIVLGGNVEVDQIHYPVGILIGQPAFVENFTPQDNLLLQCSYMKVKDPSKHTKNLIKIFNLKSVARKSMSKLDEDELWRFGVAMAMVGYPPILLLDEPFSHMTPGSQTLVTKILLEYRDKKQGTIIITSEKVTGVQALADRYMMIQDGSCLKEIEAHELENVYFDRISITPQPLDLAVSLLSLYNPMVVEGSIYLPYQGDENLASISRLLFEHNVEISEIKIEKEEVERSYTILKAPDEAEEKKKHNRVTAGEEFEISAEARHQAIHEKPSEEELDPDNSENGDSPIHNDDSRSKATALPKDANQQPDAYASGNYAEWSNTDEAYKLDAKNSVVDDSDSETDYDAIGTRGFTFPVRSEKPKKKAKRKNALPSFKGRYRD